MTVFIDNVVAGSTLFVPFQTFNSSGASVTISGLAVTDIEIYKDGNMTQRASDNGYTLVDTDGIDLDGVTGIHGFTLDLSDNTTSGFYAAGSFYTVVVSSITVDSQTVNFIPLMFRIGPVAVNATQFAGQTITAGSGVTLPSSVASQASVDTVDDFLDTEIAAIKAKTDNLPSDPADASDIASSFSTVSSALSTIAGYLDTEIAAIKAKTDNLPSDPADASVIDASFAAIDALIDSIKAVTDKLDDTVEDDAGIFRFTTNALEQAPVGGGGSGDAPTVEEIRAEIDANSTMLAGIKGKTDNLPSDPADASDISGSFSTVNSTLTTIVGYLNTEVADILAIANKLDDTLEDNGGTYRFTSAALAEGPAGGGGGGGLDAAGIRAAIGLASANLDTQLAAIDTVVDAILVDTAEIGAAGAGLTNINLPDQAMNITGNLSGSVGSVSGLTASDVSAIKAKTDALPGDPADASDIASAFTTVNSTLSTIAGYVDTEIAALAAAVADVPTNSELATALGTADDAVLAQIALVKAKTDLIPASPAATGDIPTAAQIVTEFEVQSQADPTGFHVNVKEINSEPVIGDGSSDNKWRASV